MPRTKTRKIIDVLILSGVILFIMSLFTQFLGLFGGGFTSEEILSQFFFYVSSGVAFLFGILLFWFIELLIKKDDNKFGNSMGFSSQGEFPGLKIFKNASNFQLFLGSLIIFGILGFFIFIFGQQGTFTGLRTLPQQFKPGSSLMFSSALIPASENLGAGFLIAFLFFGAKWLGRKYDWTKGTFAVLAWIVFPLIVGVYGVGNHVLRYSASTTALIVVFIFWYIIGLNFIPGWVMHFANNFFFDIRRLFDVDVARLWIGGVIALLVLIYIYLYFLRKRKKNKENKKQ